MSTFSLKGILSLDGSRWKGGLDAAQRQTKGFAKTFSITFGSILKAHLITAITDSFKHGYNQMMDSLDRAARIRDMATRIGVTPRRMMGLEYSAVQSKGTAEQVVSAVKGLAKTLQRAREMKVDPLTGESVRKDQAIFDTFRKFGLTTAQIDNFAPAAIFQAIAENVRQGANKQNRSADLQKLMEEAGDALVPMMLAGIFKTIKEGEAKGLLPTSDSILAAAALSDFRTEVQTKALAKSIGAAGASAEATKTAIKLKSDYDQASVELVKGAAQTANQAKGSGIFYSPAMDVLGMGGVNEKINEFIQSLMTTGIKIKEE